MAEISIDEIPLATEICPWCESTKQLYDVRLSCNIPDNGEYQTFIDQQKVLVRCRECKKDLALPITFFKGKDVERINEVHGNSHGPVEQPTGELCDLCKRRHTIRFHIDNEVWAKIKPLDISGGGRLCFECAEMRAIEIAGVHLAWEGVDDSNPKEQPKGLTERVDCIEQFLKEHTTSNIPPSNTFSILGDKPEEQPKGWCEICQTEIPADEIMGDQDEYSHFGVWVDGEPESHEVIYRSSPPEPFDWGSVICDECDKVFKECSCVGGPRKSRNGQLVKLSDHPNYPEYHPHPDTPESMEADGEICQVCGAPYLLIYYLPDDVWEKITPEKKRSAHGDFGAGLLCPECADKRARDIGISLYWNVTVGGWIEPEAEGDKACKQAVWRHIDTEEVEK